MTGDESGGLDELRVAARLGHLERDLALRLARAERASGDDAAAETQLRSAIERFESVRAMLGLAELLVERNEPAEAHAVLAEALSLAPNSEDVLGAYARVSLAAKVPVRAMLALEPLVRMHPSSARYTYLLGVAYMQLGDMPSATASLETSVGLDPDDPLARIALGISLNNQKLFDASVRVLTEALRLDPESVEAMAAMAEALVGVGDLEAAERYALTAIDRATSHGIASLVMGMIRLEQRDFESASDYLQQAVASDPDLPKAHYQLSLAYARLGLTEQSRAHLERYRTALESMEQQLVEVRNRLGVQEGGSRP